MSDEDILLVFGNSYSKYKLTEEVIDYLTNRFNDSESLKESYWRIKEHIEIRPTCPICGGKLKFIGKTKHIFETACSHECLVQLNNLKIKNTCLEKYGVEHFSNLEEVKTKIKSSRKTYKHSQQTKEKISKSLQGKYTYHSNNREQCKQTCIEKYGVYPVSKAEYSKHQSILTCQSKYGVDNYAKSEEFRKHISTVISSDKCQKKSIETKRQNKSLNSSSLEKKAEELLKIKYKEVLTQYRSNEYPFNCDFYVKPLDLYIECNFHWTHGPHPFDKTNNEDLERLCQWKCKNTKFYDNAINTWTVRDVNKLNIALSNNLNYKVFYTLNELKNWLEKE